MLCYVNGFWALRLRISVADWRLTSYKTSYSAVFGVQHQQTVPGMICGNDDFNFWTRVED